MPHDVDDSLMLQCASGDRNAFTQLMNRYKQSVYTFIISKTGDRDNAADLTQDVFIKLFHAVKSYKPNSRFTSLLFRIAQNVVIDSIRAKKRASILSINRMEGAAELTVPNLETDGNPAAAMESQELHGIIHQALQELPEEQRTAFMLCQYQGMRYKEIAAIQDCPVGTVKSRINKAVVHIRQILQSYDLYE